MLVYNKTWIIKQFLGSFPDLNKELSFLLVEKTTVIKFKKYL